MQTKEQKAIVDLTNAWHELAPAADHDFVGKLIYDMIGDGTTNPLKHARAIVGRLYDGLAYGNWPSAISQK